MSIQTVSEATLPQENIPNINVVSCNKKVKNVKNVRDINSQHPILIFFEIFQDMKEKKKLTCAQIKNN